MDFPFIFSKNFLVEQKRKSLVFLYMCLLGKWMGAKHSHMSVQYCED
jgi:hypothetical protein